MERWDGWKEEVNKDEMGTATGKPWKIKPPRGFVSGGGVLSLAIITQMTRVGRPRLRWRRFSWSFWKLAKSRKCSRDREQARVGDTPRLKNCIKMVRQSAACCVGCCCVLASLGGVLSLLCGIALRWLCVFFLCAVHSLLGSAYFIYTYRKIYTQYIHTYIINLKYI